MTNIILIQKQGKHHKTQTKNIIEDNNRLGNQKLYLTT
jgi:hypothetical protein